MVAFSHNGRVTFLGQELEKCGSVERKPKPDPIATIEFDVKQCSRVSIWAPRGMGEAMKKMALNQLGDLLAPDATFVIHEV